ncbi:phage major capsid protein [Faecalicoccus sp.]|uniref:phage major capsid protein n=1 Tax=Faecalicoccus sp. TaxID=1971758 RepID=UPI002A80B51D|nr:phage major capsid protein [Faecalicoccus sp.]MDY5110287.1 phage major capsid protein [Faecalicoccus sp.]
MNIEEMTLEQIATRKAEIKELSKRDDADIDALSEEVDKLNEREAQLKADKKKAEKRANLQNMVIEGAGNDVKPNETNLDSMEYRTAFMNYVVKGTRSDLLQYVQRDDAAGQSGDLGVMIPQTVVQKIIKDLEKVYGQLYSRVRKTNIQGGVKYPIGSFSATFTRITETTKSDRQKGGSITGSVTFEYKIGEIRLARTILQSVLSVPAFEAELAKVIVQAYVKAMDHEIMLGNEESNEMQGILTEANKSGGRIPKANIIEFTAEEVADWKQWQKKLFAEIPLSMRGLRPEFVMTPGTWEANIKTLADDNNRPVYMETFNPVDGAEIARFKGRDVVFVEEDILKNFDDAATGEYFAMLWVPEEAYAINTNLEFSVTRYMDHEANQMVTKALVINDGKPLDTKYIYLLKKKVV